MKHLSILSQNLSREQSLKNLQDNWNASNTFSFFVSDFEVLFDNHWSQELKQGACYVFGWLSVIDVISFSMNQRMPDSTTRSISPLLKLLWMSHIFWKEKEADFLPEAFTEKKRTLKPTNEQ